MGVFMNKFWFTIFVVCVLIAGCKAKQQPSDYKKFEQQWDEERFLKK
jgi:hypothetical protein